MKRFLIVALACLFPLAHGAQYFQDFSSAHGALVAPDLTAGKKTLAFSAKWNASSDGDAFQFTFGKFKPDTAWTNPTGLTFRIQAAPDGAEYVLFINGQIATNKPFVPPNSTKRRYFEIDWHFTNGVTVKIDGATIFKTAATFTPSFEDCFAWIARNGAAESEIAIENLGIVTDGVLAVVPSSGYFSSERNPDFGPRKAYDDDNTSEFAVFAHAGFVGGNVAPPRALLFYSFTSGIDAPDPHDWTLEGAASSSGPWTTVATGDWDFVARQETRVWPVTNNAAFASFRFSFPTNNSATLATYIGDIRLLEFKPYAPPFVADIAKTTADQFQLTFSAPPSSNYVAQFTTDFVTWNDFATNTIPQNGVWTLTDTNATNQARSYRLRQ